MSLCFHRGAQETNRILSRHSIQVIVLNNLPENFCCALLVHTQKEFIFVVHDLKDKITKLLLCRGYSPCCNHGESSFTFVIYSAVRLAGCGFDFWPEQKNATHCLPVWHVEFEFGLGGLHHQMIPLCSTTAAHCSLRVLVKFGEQI